MSIEHWDAPWSQQFKTGGTAFLRQLADEERNKKAKAMTDTLVERLLLAADDRTYKADLEGMCREAASRIAELEAALKPFAKAGELFADGRDDNHGIYNPVAGHEYGLSGADLRKAYEVSKALSLKAIERFAAFKRGE